MKQLKAARAITVRSLDTFVGPGRLRVAPNLFLAMSRAGGGKHWVFRYTKPTSGAISEMGLGSYLTVSLALARQKADALRVELAKGIDPIAVKREKRAAAVRTATTFQTALDAYCNAPAYRDKAATATLIERLTRHAAPLLKQPLDGIDVAQTAKALAKVHESAPHTGRRTLAGIARVFDYARVKGLIDARRPNPATFRGGFEHLWGSPEPTVHLRAVPYEQVPALYAQLRDLDDMSVAWCLRFLILTGVRSSNALYARFDQIDLKAATWTIAPEDMKMKHRPPFVVPLVPEAVAIVTEMRDRYPAGELIFPSDRHFGKQHRRSLAYVLQYVLGVEASVHGFRSSLRDFLGDRTNVERETAEMCLQHFSKGTEAAYRRSTALEKRRIALTLWARHVVGEGEADTVVPFKQASG